jgi:hypothetical protein
MDGHPTARFEALIERTHFAARWRIHRVTGNRFRHQPRRARSCEGVFARINREYRLDSFHKVTKDVILSTL